MSEITEMINAASVAFWVETVAILAGGLIAVTIVMRFLRMVVRKRGLESVPFGPFLVAVRWILVLVVLGVVLQRFGVEVMSILTAGLAMVAIGVVAVWSMLSNVMATLLLVLNKPFRVNDRVGFVGEETAGRAVDLNLFFTTLETEDGDLLQIPNNLFFQRVIRVRRGTGRTELSEQLGEGQSAAQG